MIVFWKKRASYMIPFLRSFVLHCDCARYWKHHLMYCARYFYRWLHAGYMELHPWSELCFLCFCFFLDSRFYEVVDVVYGLMIARGR